MDTANFICVVECADGLWMANGEPVLYSTQTDNETLAAFADMLTERAGGPRVRLVVFVVDTDLGKPCVISCSPRWICKMSRAHAIAHCAPISWKRFFVVEEQPQLRVSLVFRSGRTRSVHPTTIRTVGDAERVATALGVGHSLSVYDDPSAGNSRSQLSDITFAKPVNSRISTARGAAVYAREFSRKRHGVWCSGIDTVMKVARSVSYSIHRPPKGVFAAEDPTLRNVVRHRPVVIVGDSNVARLYGPAWSRYAGLHLNVLGDLRITSSECCKTLYQAEQICEFALRAGLPRDGILLAIGGGVTLDVVGFAASLYRRGIGYIRIPTTLVGLADVSVGIKQGVNAWNKKNLLGAFYPCVASVNDYRLLSTLPEKEIACGMAEIAKIALLRDEHLFRSLATSAEELLNSRFQQPSDIATEIGLRAELLMMEELAPNLFEGKLARLVDFGHTFSPAIEACSGYQIAHGHAVGIDMALSISVAVLRGLAPLRFLRSVVGLFERIGLPIAGQQLCSTRELWNSLESIRLHRAGALNLVVVRNPGEPIFLNDLDRRELDLSFNQMLRQCLPAGERLGERGAVSVGAAV